MGQFGVGGNCGEVSIARVGRRDPAEGSVEAIGGVEAEGSRVTTDDLDSHVPIDSTTLPEPIQPSTVANPVIGENETEESHDGEPERQ